MGSVTGPDARGVKTVVEYKKKRQVADHQGDDAHQDVQYREACVQGERQQWTSSAGPSSTG